MRGRGTWDVGPGAWRVGHGVLAALLIGVSPLVAQQKVPLVLHHIVVTIDTATWDDAFQSPFVRDQFAATQPVWFASESRFVAFPLFGRYNHLMLARASRDTSRQVGDIGIVLASEHAGGLDQLRKQGAFAMMADERLLTVRGNGGLESRNRVRPAGADSMSGRVAFQIQESSATDAQQRFPADSLPPGNVSNSRFLAQYFDPRKLFSHLTGATLAIPVDDIARISRVLERDGVAVVHDGEGAIIKLDGFTLHLIPPYRGAGVKQLQFALTHAAPANPTYRFGPKSQLRFGPGLIAVWDFDVK